ncbi:MAG: sodium-dependent transporter, partial [Gemmatimonadales bacterium]
GLGNIWRFPYVVGENGGAAFVLIYLGFVFLVGAPVMLAELSLGRGTGTSPVTSFKRLAPGSLWPFVGVLFVFAGIGILSFYGVIAGWTLGYFFKTLGGSFAQSLTAEESTQLYEGFVGNWKVSIGLLIVFLSLTGFVVWRGVSRGIELTAKILMPLLLLLLVVLAARSVTLSGAGDGLRFYLTPDFSKITPQSIPTALGQALFSLSLGMGTMATYGSYLRRSENLASSAGIICLFDTTIALLAGLIIFPALFHAGLAPDDGPGLVFQVLPTLFATLPAGQVFGAAFFLLLTIAALTSTISQLEVPVAYLIDEWQWTRGKAVASATAVTFVVGIPSALASGAVDWLTGIPGLGTDFLSLMAIVIGNYALSLGALLIAIFVGWRWGVTAAIAEVEAEGVAFNVKVVWAFCIRFVCPVAVVGIITYIVLTGNYF